MNGFFTIPDSVATDLELSVAARFLYGVIHRRAQKRGYCYAGNASLQKLLGCSESTVKRLIRELKKRGHVTVELVSIRGGGTQRRIVPTGGAARQSSAETTRAPAALSPQPDRSPVTGRAPKTESTGHSWPVHGPVTGDPLIEQKNTNTSGVTGDRSGWTQDRMAQLEALKRSITP